MQSNNFLQPNIYYQVQQSKPPAKPRRRPIVPIVIIIVLMLGLISLGGYILVDKFFSTDTPEEIVNDLSATPANLALSAVQIPANASDDILKNVLAGRSFWADELGDQYLTFTSTAEYTLSYYRNPNDAADYAQNLPSEHNGTYTVKDHTISLSGGETFTITGDYLIKDTGTLSANQGAVYFDANQLPLFKKNLVNALSRHLKQLQADNSSPLQVQKVSLSTHSCTNNPERQSKADNFTCHATYTINFNAADIEQLAQTGTSFTQLCPQLAASFNAADRLLSCASSDSQQAHLQSWSNFIIRIKSPTDYEITGSFRE